MPKYSNSALAAPTQLLQDGVPCYLFGTYNSRQGNTQMLVSQVALTANVATLTVQITSGEVPVVGALISVAQTQNSAGLFNVSRVALTAVSINTSTGAGTVSFALTNANVSAVADTGSAVVEVPEIAESLTNSASVAVAVQPTLSQRTVTTSIQFPVMPTAATVVLQVAERNVDSEFTSIGNAAVVASSAFTTGPTVQFTLTRGNYYRFLVSGVAGTNPTVVGKVL